MKPNILFILTDQQSADAMSCTGNPWVKTPAMDRLAAQGTRFKRAYCTHPLCAPARSSLFTGLMPHQTGVCDNGISFDVAKDVLGLGHHLAEAGYRCVHAGRGPAPTVHGFEMLGEEGAHDYDVTPLAVSFLNREHDTAFFLSVSYHNPHNICERARWQNLPDADIEETSNHEQWPLLPANFQPAPYEAEAVRWVQRSRYHPHPETDWTFGEWQQYLYAYYRMVEAVDTEIGRLLDGLEESGLADNTVIIFSSDHGNGSASHKWNQKTVLFEECVRVPLIVVDPDSATGGSVDEDHLVSVGLDLFATASDYAGIDRPDDREGLSFRPIAGGRKPENWRQHLVIETTLSMLGVPAKPQHTFARAVVSERYKYSVYPLGRHREQLIDLIADPGEMVNCAVSSRFRSELLRHRELLSVWSKRTGDRLPVPNRP